MAAKKTLVTGGAGFIGSHLARALLDAGHEVTVLDSHEPQVHHGRAPAVDPRARHLRGDVADEAALREALADQQVVFHLAAQVGVGQSMYQPARYVRANALGTATLLERLVAEDRTVEKLVVASSMSIYGEGLYRGADGAVRPAGLRGSPQMAQGKWEVLDPETGEPLRPEPTPEDKPLQPTSVYALSKRDQEEYALLVGEAYGLPTVALRFFNVYGPGQSLSNPYTGVCAIFSSRIKNGQRPVVYEDGLQSRDFVSVHDVVRANLAAMERSGADGQAVNVGTGRATSVLEIARVLAALYGRPDLAPEVTGAFRKGDVRHCFADVRKARRLLGYEPRVGLDEGLRELVAWGERQDAVDRFDDATKELRNRSLLEGR